MDTAKHVYFVRHGESESNATRIMMGAEAKLTEKGISQAEFVGTRFTRIPIDIILTSTMRRAIDTGSIVSEKTGVGIEQHEFLSERRHPTEIMGLHKDDPKQTKIEGAMLSNIGDPSWHYSDEENLFDLKERAQKALAFLRDRKERHIAVVTHGTFLRIMIGCILFGEHWNPELIAYVNRHMLTNNTGITVCECTEHEWCLRAWNDHAHLG